MNWMCVNANRKSLGQKYQFEFLNRVKNSLNSLSIEKYKLLFLPENLMNFIPISQISNKMLNFFTLFRVVGPWENLPDRLKDCSVYEFPGLLKAYLWQTINISNLKANIEFIHK
jgi:hypothetical protein